MTEILIVGWGPAGAATARLLARLGRDVVLVDAGRELPFDPRIILPPSAIDALDFLGVRASVEARGVEVEDVQLRGGGAGGIRQHAGLRIAEGALSETLREGVKVPVERERVAGLLEEDGAVVGVQLESGRELRADLTLCSVPGLLPESLSPRALGPADRASTMLIDVPRTRFPGRRHLLESSVDGWAWAVRYDDDRVQYTWFCDLDVAKEPMLPKSAVDLGLSAQDARWLRRPIVPCLPAEQVMPGIMPVGLAAYRLHPLSSLGSAHSLQSARMGAAAANTCFQSSRNSVELATWLAEEHMTSALRAQALTALAFADAAQEHEGGYWQKRSNADWFLSAVAPEKRRLAERVVLLQELHRDGRFLSTSLRLSGALNKTTQLVQRGAMVRERPALAPEGGLPIVEEDWASMQELADAFASGATLEQVLSQQIPDGLPAMRAREMERALARVVSILFEKGFLELVA